MKLAAAYCPFTDLGEYAPYVLTGDLMNAFTLCGEYGFEGIEISIRKPDDIVDMGLMELLHTHSVSVSAFATGQNFTRDGLCFVSPEKEVRKGAVDRLKLIIKLAAEVMAPVIIGGIRGNQQAAQTPSQQLISERTRHCMEQVVEFAEIHDTVILYEAVNRYEIATGKSLDETADTVRSYQSSKIRLLADTYHMNIEDTSLDESILRNKDVLGYVHLCDSNRKAAGLGNINFEPIFKALNEIDYNGYLCAEVLPVPSPREVLQITRETFLKYVTPTVS